MPRSVMKHGAMFKGESQPIRQSTEHLNTVLDNIETVNGLDVSLLITELGMTESNDAIERLAKKYKGTTGTELRVDLIFDIDDPKILENYSSREHFLGFLKALLEGYNGQYINEIVVKGPPNAPNLERNVFSSGVKFKLRSEEV